MALIKKLENIGNAIREKTGKTDLLTLEQMVTEIAAIETGGGSTDVEDNLVTRKVSNYTNNRITTIGYHAFNSCTSLYRITCPNVTEIQYFAFGNCISLQVVDIPKVTKIGANAFNACTKLTTLNFPNAETLETGAFDGCRALKEITLPKALTKLPSNIFTDCTAMTSFNFPNVTTIEGNAFDGCESLESITLPSIATLTGGLVFGYCSALKKVILPSCTKLGYTSQYSATFRQATALEAVILPGNTLCALASTTGTFGNTSSSYASAISLGTGYIYVPRALVDTYKAATNWSTYAGQIRAIEDYPDICADVLKADGTIKTAAEIKAEMEAA